MAGTEDKAATDAPGPAARKITPYEIATLVDNAKSMRLHIDKLVERAAGYSAGTWPFNQVWQLIDEEQKALRRAEASIDEIVGHTQS